MIVMKQLSTSKTLEFYFGKTFIELNEHAHENVTDFNALNMRS